MAAEANEGDVYRINLYDGKPAHYWIVLNQPQAIDGTFLAVSLTDRHNLDPISDVWEFNYPLCGSLRLSKPSIVALRYALVKTKTWLDELNAEFICTCTDAALKRARCNLIWYPQLVSADVKKYARFYAGSWESCGSAPPHPLKSPTALT